MTYRPCSSHVHIYMKRSIYTAYIYIYKHSSMHAYYIHSHLPLSLYIHMLHRFHSCPHWHPACIVHVGRLLCAESHFTCTIWDCVKTEWAITWMRASMNTLGQQTVMQLQQWLTYFVLQCTAQNIQSQQCSTVKILPPNPFYNKAVILTALHNKVDMQNIRPD